MGKKKISKKKRFLSETTSWERKNLTSMQKNKESKGGVVVHLHWVERAAQLEQFTKGNSFISYSSAGCEVPG